MKIWSLINEFTSVDWKVMKLMFVRESDEGLTLETSSWWSNRRVTMKGLRSKSQLRYLIGKWQRRSYARNVIFVISSVSVNEGLTPETSASSSNRQVSFYRRNLIPINFFDTKFSWFISSSMRFHSFLRNFTLRSSHSGNHTVSLCLQGIHLVGPWVKHLFV